MVEVVAKAARRRAAGRECCIVLERLLVCSGCFAVAQLILDLILPRKEVHRFYSIRMCWGIQFWYIFCHS